MSGIMEEKKIISKKSKIIICTLVCCVICMILCFVAIGQMDDHIQHNSFFDKKVSIYEKKEELFVFVNHHQAELDILLEEMKEAYEANGEEAIYLSKDSWQSDYVFPCAETLIQEYPIMSIAVNHKDDVNSNSAFAITICFQQANSSILADDYWGIYYVETGQPLLHSSEITESCGIYYSTYGCIYETEKIMGNWYYYRERW